MAVKIRLARHGRKASPFYFIVAADSRAPRDGKFLEKLGTYNPMTNPATINLNFDRAYYWLNVGAQPTDTARSILKKEGVLYKKHLQGGVEKGAFDQNAADSKFQAWKDAQGKKNEKALNDIKANKEKEASKLLEAEKKVNAARAEKIAEKQKAAAEAATAAEAPAEETPAPAAE